MKVEINKEIHQVCKHYFSEKYTNFQLNEIETGKTIQIGNPNFNNLIVILKGTVLIEYDEYRDTLFSENEMVFIPAYSKSTIIARDESKLLIGTFDMPNDVCNLKSLESLEELRFKKEYTFTSVSVKPPMKQFLDLLILYLENGIQCDSLHEIKEKEVFLVFRWYYTDEEFVSIFHPIIGKALDFRTLVIKNHLDTKSIAELAEKVGMSRSTFDTKFKDVFGITPKQWILKRKAKSIRYFMSKPNVTISDIMIQYDFESFTHFNRFCKQQFGKSPSEILKDKNER